VRARATGPLPVLVGAGLVGVLGLAACNDVTYDASATTAPKIAPSTTAYVATGSPKELLASMADEIGSLSERLVANSGQKAALARVLAQWAAVRPTIQSQRPELLAGFDSVLAEVQQSVNRRRPADADKAAKNLAVLIRSYEG
jgi:hypothetical protein